MKEAEIWTPPIDEIPKGLSRIEGELKLPRLYHSAAVLLCDGTTMVGGGGLPPDKPTKVSDGEVYNGDHESKGKFDRYRSKDGTELWPTPFRNVEIYRPSYLYSHTGDTTVRRPKIEKFKGHFSYGGQFELQWSGPNPIETVSIISTSSCTHGHANNQRFRKLDFKNVGEVDHTGAYSLKDGTSRIRVDMPESAGDLPPGYYMVFIVDTRGVPSTALRFPKPAIEHDASKGVIDVKGALENFLPALHADDLHDIKGVGIPTAVEFNQKIGIYTFAELARMTGHELKEMFQKGHVNTANSMNEDEVVQKAKEKVKERRMSYGLGDVELRV